MEWLSKKPNTLKYHLAHPELDASRYIQAKRLGLGRDIALQRRIYMDTKQWIQLRDVATGQSRNCIQAETYKRLQFLRAAGRIICPISYSVFAELMTQTDDSTRVATARVIDQLADGCCCLPPDSLMERELMYFMVDKALGGNHKQPPVPHTVWTKMSFVLGDVMPVTDSLPVDILSAMQRSCDDLLCSATVEDIIRHLDPSGFQRQIDDERALVKAMTDGKQLHAKDHSTFHGLFCAEIYGGLDAQREILEDVMCQISAMCGFHGEMSEAERRSAGQSLAMLIANAFRHHKIDTELPQIHIHAALHAALRWDKCRKYSANDFEDIRHATVSLPYYDLFCTERSLCHLITQKSLSLDKRYCTKVICSDSDFLEYVSSVV